jgi:DNA polymerase-3 subunit epsilon
MTLPLDVLAPGWCSLAPDGRLTPGSLPEDEPLPDTLVVVDLEMSGPNPQLHEVLEVGIIRVRLAPGFPEEAAWGARVRPRHIGNANPAALKVVGYSPRAWRDALELDAAVARVAEMSSAAIVTGWGLAQDTAFLAEICRRSGVAWPFASLALDIQLVARKELGGTGAVDRFNLGHVADRLGIGRMGEHSALADAYAAYDVLTCLVERAAQRSLPA